MPWIVIVALLLCISQTLATREQSFVIEKSENDIISRHKRSLVSSGIKSLHVTSVIQSRFARVSFVSKMENAEDVAKEMTFSVRLPEAAFITEFNMVVDGVTFIGKIKEKEAAKKQFEQAAAKGHTAGLVAADVRETRTFDVSANVPAKSSVDFHLVYQQLLKRRLGSYNHVIMVNLGQIIEDFVIDVYITEMSRITSISTESPGKGSGVREKVSRGDKEEGRVEVYTDVRRSKNQAKVTFKPTQTQQRRLLNLPEDEQKYTVNYDVTREFLGGEIQTRNGYFVHFFAPEDLPILPKNVVFVIDRSGSMSGRKMEQTKAAFVSVLKELRDSDRFNIISFSTDTTTWKNVEDGLMDVTTLNVDEAVQHVQGMVASGGTNLNDAILDATKLLKNATTDEEKSSSMIIILSDGQPTSGTTNTAQIRLNAKRAIGGKFSLFCLGFGNDIDHNFLKKLANENDGIARKIYQDSDANLQLEGFFQEVATPLLLDVKMRYSGADQDAVSHSDFDKYFKGSEAVIVGAMGDSSDGITSVISGLSEEGEVTYRISSTEIDDSFQHWYKDSGDFDDFIERLWAYFTIRDLLEKKTLSESQVEKQEITSRIIQLALKYKFVTPLTSMVVTLPEDEISTTPDGPVIEPTIPPCLLRGSEVPDHLTRHPIWCPVILGNRRLKPGRPSHPPMLSRMRSTPSRSGTLRRTSSIQYNLGGSSRMHRLSGGSAVSFLWKPNTYLRRMRPVPRRRIFTTTTPPLTMFTTTTTTTTSTTLLTTTARSRSQKFNRKCSGKLKTSTGTINLSENILLIRKNYKCKWTVVLPKGSWIDLYAKTLNTTSNKVEISKGGENVLSHHGGYQEPQFISVQYNKISIILAISPSDEFRPGIEISYAQFTPDSDSAPAVAQEVEMPQDSTPNCGNVINSTDSAQGIISSPRYPKMYLDNLKCEWGIFNSDTTTHNLRITFETFDVETGPDGLCSHDIFTVERGDTEERFCGYDIPDDITTDEEFVKIMFLSDESLGGEGFRLRYEFVAK